MNTDINNIIPIIAVAGLTLLGNILYFEYEFKKEAGKKILRQKLTDLLLPLYIVFKRDELAELEWYKNDNLDMYEFFSDMPQRLVEDIYEIFKKNIYLADDELYVACLEFLEWGFSADAGKRFQRIHDEEPKEDIAFKKFRELVYLRFEKIRKDYLT